MSGHGISHIANANESDIHEICSGGFPRHL